MTPDEKLDEALEETFPASDAFWIAPWAAAAPGRRKGHNRPMQRASRPVFLNFARIRFPVGAIASIGHRLSGLMLVLALPFGVLALERSLSDEAAFSSLLEAARSPAGRMAVVLIAWGCAHHVLAGIRHLLSDVGVGASLGASRASAYVVLVAAAALGAVAAFLP